LLIASAFLISPQFQSAVLFDFHPEVMGLFSIFSAFAFLVSSRANVAIVAVASAFLFKEDASLVAIGLSWLFFLAGYKRHAACLLCASLCYFVLVTNLVMPSARGGAGGPQARWEYLGQTGTEIAASAVRHPDLVVDHLSLPGPRSAIATLVSTQALLPLATPATVILLPITLAHLLSTHEAEMQLHLHYGALPYGLAFLASTFGAAAIVRSRRLQPVWKRLHLAEPQRAVALASLFLVAQLVAAVTSGPFGLNFQLSHYSRPAEHTEAIRDVIKLVPPNASLAAQSGILPHVSQRQEVWEFPPAFGAQYVLLDTASWHASHGPPGLDRDWYFARTVLPGHGYCLIVEQSSVQLWHLCKDGQEKESEPASDVIGQGPSR
jgi:uncharacterized membrane protein